MTDGKKLEQILDQLYERAQKASAQSVIENEDIRTRVDYTCSCMSNRAGVRLLMACLLGKIDNPNVDPRKPYTEISSKDCFSGRKYDEHYLTAFINKHRLPCNPTTAFLTPALRNINKPLTTDREIIGFPRKLYVVTLELLEDVAENRIAVDILFVEVIRLLLLLRDEKLSRIDSLLKSIEKAKGALPLAAEAIVTLIKQHFACKNASRLPVLVVAAAYHAAEIHLGARALPLNAHNAADLQTGSLGDVEIRIVSDDTLVTAYEMKMKRVSIDDIDTALKKIVQAPTQIDSYIFVTTDIITEEVADYAAMFYEETGGTEIAILDCIGFLRHFLHLFHRLRIAFLDAYQNLVLNEPDSAVSQTLKEAFLILRQTAETGE